jgi:NADH:ubiquinone oxidoreductase subunit 4 (subunit M)
MPTDLTLTFIVFLPMVGSLVILALPVRTDLQRFRVRTTALFATAVPLLFAAYDMLAAVTSSAGGALPQPTLDAPWLRGFFFQMDYHVGTDGINLMLLFAVSAVFPALVLASWRYRGRYRSYFALLLMVEVGLNGAFATQDLLLFLIFFWWPVVPLSLLVSFGAGARASLAARRLLLIQSAGALTLLAAVLLMLLETGNTTFNFQTLASVGPVKGSIGLAVAVLLLVAFGARMAIFPFQRWFVEAISAAPTPVAMLVTICALPVGGYGLVRVALDIDPRGSIQLVVPLLALSLVTLYWGAIAARGGRDLRRVVANSLVAIGGPVLLGVTAFSETSVAGALGLCFAYVFFAPLAVLAAGSVCDRAGRERIRELIGAAATAPRLRLMFALSFAALVGVPLLAGFPGLFQILLGALVAHRFVTALTVFGLLLLTAAAWRAGTMVFWTGPPDDQAGTVSDSHGSEFYAAWVLGAALVVFGVSSGYFVPYTVRGTDLVSARVSSLAPPAAPTHGTKAKK